MKKTKLFAYASAIALVSSGFASCSSEDDIAANPNFDAEKNAVKTEFVINVTQPGERTRMSSDAVGNGAFQGINNMYLFPLTAAPTDQGLNGIQLDNTGLTPALSDEVTNSSSKVYTLYIPTGTTNFLFYATAKATATAATDGILENNYATASTVTDVKFNLKPIVAAAADVTTPQNTLLGILNGLTSVSITTPEALTWKSLSASTATEYKALGAAYDAFVDQADAPDVRQGSAKAILEMAEDLFNAANDIYTNEANATAKALAKAILEKLKESFSVTESSGIYTWAAAYKSTDTKVINYPEAQGLPAGSAILKCENGTFSYINDGSIGTAAVSTAYNKINYPAQLVYYCNSGLRQTNQSKKTTDYPITSSNWIADASWSPDWKTTAVTAATRAVAMTDNITYGVAQLASSVSIPSSVTSFTDNAKAVTNNELENNVFDSANPISLSITGMLIGGQPDAAKYDYLPNGTSFTQVIYDPITPAAALSSTAVDNYTLVLDNYTTATEQADVNVAIELTADKEFYGADGVIAAGQKFYLIGSLNAANKSGSTIDWNKHVSFKSGDAGQGTDRVFIRDAKTVAAFTLKATSLQNAYSTIPDLRSTQMLFGLSVDLLWKAGLTYNVEL